MRSNNINSLPTAFDKKGLSVTRQHLVELWKKIDSLDQSVIEISSTAETTESSQEVSLLWEEYKSGISPVNNRRVILGEGDSVEELTVYGNTYVSGDSTYERWKDSGGASLPLSERGNRSLVGYASNSIIGALNEALSSGGNSDSEWTLNSSLLYPNLTTTDVVIGGNSAIGLAKFSVHGESIFNNEVYSNETIAQINAASSNILPTKEWIDAQPFVNEWTLTGATLTPNATTTNVVVGGTSALGKLSVADTVAPEKMFTLENGSLANAQRRVAYIGVADDATSSHYGRLDIGLLYNTTTTKNAAPWLSINLNDGVTGLGTVFEADENYTSNADFMVFRSGRVRISKGILRRIRSSKWRAISFSAPSTISALEKGSQSNPQRALMVWAVSAAITSDALRRQNAT